MRVPLLVRWTTAGILFVFAAYISFTELTEAYGAGPPFYNRTTNMDKWANPWPLVIGVDIIAILLIWLLLQPRRDRRDRQPGDR